MTVAWMDAMGEGKTAAIVCASPCPLRKKKPAAAKLAIPRRSSTLISSTERDITLFGA
jgi:hypothetical protein